MKSFAVFLTLCCSAWAQPTIQTLFGGSPVGLPALSASTNNPIAAAVDAQGNVYAALKDGHQVVEIGPGGRVIAVAGNGISGYNGDGGPAVLASIDEPSGLAFDQAGNLYISDMGNNVVRMVDTNGMISTFAGTGQNTFSGDGGPAVLATLNQPSELAFDAAGNLLIADTSNHSIRKVDLNGMITTFAGVGTQSAGGDAGPANQAGLNMPQGVAIDSSGNVYISDTGNNKIRIVTTDGIISVLAGVGYTGYGGDQGDPLRAVFNLPTSLAVDSLGQLYIVDSRNYRVRVIKANGQIVSFAGTGTPGAEGDGGVAMSANVTPAGMFVNATNDVLIADGTNNRVRIVTSADGVINTILGNGISSYNPQYLTMNGDFLYVSDGTAQRVRSYQFSTGVIATVAGTGSSGFLGDGMAAYAALISNPRGMAFDKQGNMYFADSGNHRIREIDTSGNINTIAGTGAATSTGDGGTALTATLNQPVDIAIDGSGNIFIAERSGERVRKITKDGLIATVAGTGSGGPPSSETGVAIAQRLNLPQGLFAEPGGSILIADSNNNRVRRLTPDGTITTIAGTAVAGYDGDGGPATSALLHSPIGVTEDSDGNIYINDSVNSAVRQIGADGIITTVAGSNAQTGSIRPGGFNGDGSPATNFLLNRPVGLSVGPGSCTVILADTTNGRVRQVTAGVSYSLATNPAGLQVVVDGGSPLPTPATVTFAPGSSHVIDVPAEQDNGAGTRYLSTGPLNSTAACATPRQSMTVNLQTQYSLTLTPDPGGAITNLDGSMPDGWLNTGAQVTLMATPAPGFIFTGWDGDCATMSPTGACQLTMTQPYNAIAHFAPQLGQ